MLVLAGCGKGNIENKSQSNNATNEEPQEKDRGLSQDNVSSESLTACQGKSEGDNCEMTMTMPSKGGEEKVDEKKAIGICKKSPENEQLACRPEGPGKPGGPRPNMAE